VKEGVVFSVPKVERSGNITVSTTWTTPLATSTSATFTVAKFPGAVIFTFPSSTDAEILRPPRAVTTSTAAAAVMISELKATPCPTWRARTAETTASERTRLFSAAKAVRVANASLLGAKIVMSASPSRVATKSWATRDLVSSVRDASAAVSAID
jgi:hypothetical protein